jgi:hypothetical protein
MASNNWGEAYFGPQYSSKYFGASISAGVQQSNNVFSSQFDAGLRLGDSKTFLSMEAEFDPSLLKNTKNLWYEIYFQQHLFDVWSAGIRSREGVGSGMFVDIRTKLHIVLCWLPVDQENKYKFSAGRIFGYVKLGF